MSFTLKSGQEVIVGSVGTTTRLLVENPRGEISKGGRHYNIVLAGQAALLGTVQQPEQQPNQPTQ